MTSGTIPEKGSALGHRVGFLVFLLIIFSVAHSGVKRATASTVPEAREILERIAAEENGEHRRDEQ